jgi:hypothetical protein
MTHVPLLLRASNILMHLNLKDLNAVGMNTRVVCASRDVRCPSHEAGGMKPNASTTITHATPTVLVALYAQAALLTRTFVLQRTAAKVNVGE